VKEWGKERRSSFVEDPSQVQRAPDFSSWFWLQTLKVNFVYVKEWKFGFWQYERLMEHVAP
jgi:hypothetical protein